MDQSQTSDEKQVAKQDKNPLKNCKENRYYYRHREEILEKRRIARIAKKGIDVTTSEEAQMSMDERRKKKMEFLGLLDDSKIVPCVSPGV